ncbi:MAG TPA: cytochrome b [Stellaceae bacterium]|nr:cytochrome b [Stellaceae bacterium]
MFYRGTARFLHCLVAALIVIIMPMGLVMVALDRGLAQNILFITHESLGLTVLALMLARLAWRLTHPAPAPSAALSPLERRASGGVHWALYGLLLAMPVTGYITVVAGGFPLTYFALINVPRMLEKDEPLSKLAGLAHVSLQYAVYALVALHVAAALHHHFIRRNDVLARMWPNVRRR